MKVLALSGIGTKTCLAHFTRLVSDSTTKAFGVPLKIKFSKGVTGQMQILLKDFLAKKQ